MRECPWCGFKNLNVYAYCQQCGRGFDDPFPDDEKKDGERENGAPKSKGFLARLLGR